LISRARVAKNFYIDGTFHHPKYFSQILIIIIKDIIINEYIPCFYILMSHRNEILYTLVFQSINNILTQNGHYKLNITIITTDAEKALINGINNTFTNITRVSCWFHLKQNLFKKARESGLLSTKSKKINPNITKNLIYELSLIPFKYKGNMQLYDTIIEELKKKFPEHTNFIIKGLNLEECQNIKDFSFISKLEKLECLNPSFTDIYYISFLEKNANIKELYLERCFNINDYSSISKLEKIENL